MPIRLIDADVLTPVEIEGTTFHVKTLNNGQKLKLAQKAQEIEGSEDGYNDLLRLVAEHIDHIEGFEDSSVEDVLLCIESVKSQAAVISGVLGTSTFSEDEAKNSSCSSDGSAPASTETVDETAARENASPSGR